MNLKPMQPMRFQREVDAWVHELRTCMSVEGGRFDEIVIDTDIACELGGMGAFSVQVDAGLRALAPASFMGDAVVLCVDRAQCCEVAEQKSKHGRRVIAAYLNKSDRYEYRVYEPAKIDPYY